MEPLARPSVHKRPFIRRLRKMSLFSSQSLDGLLQQYGYGVIFIGVMLESIGLPLPGESLLIAAAIYAGTAHHMNIFVLIALAAAGAISGDQIGYFVGRRIGDRTLSRWGQKIGLGDERLDLGRFLFRRYGGAVVFLGRFVAILRTFAALLAGANRMPWHTFLLWNALGGIAWTSLYGFSAYLLGDAAKRISGPAGVVLAVTGGAALLFGFIFVKRNERRLLSQARREMTRATGNDRLKPDPFTPR
jgi:membrane protein DedA with SNARE-associated domain